MKTAELIDALAGDAAVARPAPCARMLLGAAALGALIATAALVAWLGMQPMALAVRTPTFWMKAAYTAWLALAGGWMALRLARPGGQVGGLIGLVAAAVAWLAALAILEAERTAPSQAAALWLGQSWNACPFRILALALPTYVLAILVLRRLAPTRLGLAGAAAGLFAGGVGATVYGLFCRETTAAFVVVWYSLGLATTAILGAIAGKRLLRW